jgi:hypothetical protein
MLMHTHHFHLFGHHATATNGAPQVTAVGFASLIIFTLVLPFVEVSTNGTTAPLVLVQLIKTTAGFNVFAPILLLIPPLGIAVAMTAHSAWRIGSMFVALVALAAIPLAVFTLNHSMLEATHDMAGVQPGVGSYVLMVGYAILAVATGISAWRARNS